MHFSSIELYNYGIYKGLHTLNLVNQQEQKNITLIGGMNGRGKTTLLDSVFLCLYGRKAIEFVAGKKEAYNKVLRDRINKSSQENSTYIKLTMEMEDEEETTISITRLWQQNDRKINTSLRVEKNGISDNYLSENWEYYVEELIPFGIAKFFFFDNEKISQLADDDAFEKIKDSIKSVMGVTTIESLCGHIEKIRKNKNANIKKSETTTLTRDSEKLSADIEHCETKLRSVYAQKSALVPKLEKTADMLEQAEQDFWKKGGNLGFHYDTIRKDQHSLREKADWLKEEALTLAANPATPLCLCPNLAADTYNRIQSEEESHAKYYSLPVITKMYGTLLSDFQSSYSDSSDSYIKLSELVSQQLTELENEVAQKHANVLAPLAQTLIEKFVSSEARSITDKCAYLIAENEKTLTALAQLEVHLSSNAEKNETTKFLEKIKELQALKTHLQADIAKYDDQIKSVNFEKEQLERQLNKVLLKMAEEADTSDDNVRIIKYSTMTLEIMHTFANRLQAQKVSQLEKNITSCFEFLAQKQGIITSISIHPESLDITLRDYNGGTLLKEQLSAGEKQMFAISILWGLALSSGYKLPVIIDTPMARLDSAHRSNFINKYLPNASSQVIVLSTDEEINGKYLNDIKDYINSTYTLVYDEEDKCTSINPGYFGGSLL